MVSTNRMHGVITNGGFKPNIIPSYTSSEWYLRALNEDDLLKIESDFKNFVNAAAMSTKCDVKIESPDYRYTEIDNNKVRCVAADGHRLALSEGDFNNENNINKQLLITSKFINMLKSINS